ncbi:molybdenum cofactor biosynthesis protein MoaE [Alkalibacillus salilacus]|uniref:Molybdopterin synthase catalytic subunit n=1 Tax=Alkalibacillus salilacus TaxID=284582 RepID=A0ABT9VBD6_9BACI|nr:molybdenum cofactor biosynthesis protein MoaE [Alkalibacillus salilacus]MDQ0158278.1 molybdopterin synthase catalytic subunit [Alkalibacillus salilacus]
MKRFEVVTEPIDPERYREYVVRPEAGGVTVFTGHVREWTKGIRTVYLSFEAYTSMAEKMMEQIGREIEEKWPETRVAMAHRIGELHISDIAVVIAVSSPHRKAAYEANEYAIERLKEDVPIWKKEHWENGEYWVGHQNQKPKGEDINE